MNNLFGLLFESKEEREKSYHEYSFKIFPYGEPQKQKIRGVLEDLITKKVGDQIMMHYVLIKQAMIESKTKDYEAIAARVEKSKYVKLNPELKSCVRILIERDLAMDEALKYPTAQELKSMASKSS